MTDIKTLALKYGGYTSLDKVYLDQLLAGKTEQEQLALVTPPPSVVNAYFAELYQKKSPQAATDYFSELSQELNLYNTEPSFTEESKPFIRLNLSGKSFGFCYESEGLGRIFFWNEEKISEDLLFEIAQIFPHQLVFEESGKIYMKAVGDEEVVSVENITALTDWKAWLMVANVLKATVKRIYYRKLLLFLASAISDRKTAQPCYILIN